MAEPRDSVLRSAPRRASRDYGMGPDTVQIWQYSGRCAREVAVRSVLHQERFGRLGFADPVSDHQDRPARTRSAMRWLFWSAALLIAYTYAGYAVCLWLRARVSPWPIRLWPQQPCVSVV